MHSARRTFAALLLLALVLSVAPWATPSALAAGADFTLVPQGATNDGNGLLADFPIEVRGGQVAASASGPGSWVGKQGSSTAKVTGTYDPSTGMFEAVYTGEHKNTREAGDVVQDVRFTFTGKASQTIRPGDQEVQIAFVGKLTNEITGGPAQPPTTTRDHNITVVYAIQGAAATSEEGAKDGAAGQSATPGKERQATPATSGGFPVGTVLIGIAAVGIAAIGIGALVKNGIGGAQTAVTGAAGAVPAEPSPEEPEAEEEPAEDEEEQEEDDDKVILELTYPVGRSPKVFTTGWVFGARCVVISADGEETDLSDSVEWSGSGDFTPETGHRSRPSFADEGANTIVLSCDAGGRTVRRTFPVAAVSPAAYASVGTFALCPADSHGCLACPHPVVGPVVGGSGLVTANGSPAARQGDPGMHKTCCGPNTFVIAEGDPEVLIEGRPAARFGDRTDHCGGPGNLVRGHQVGDISASMWREALE